MKKRILPVYTLLIVLLISSLVFALSTFTGSSAKAVPGTQGVVFPILLDNDEAVAGFQVEVNYSTTELVLANVETTSRTEHAVVVFNDTPSIVIIAVLANDSDNLIETGEGAVLNLVFNVDESASTAVHTIDLEEVIAVNISAVTLDVAFTDGLFEIVEPYGFEFLPPISLFENFTLQEGATLPLKFNVTNATDFIIDNSVLVRVYNISKGIDHVYNATDIGSDFIDIDGIAGQYHLNIHTGQLNMSEGMYTIDVLFDNYQVETIGFELVDKSQGIGKGKNK